MCLYVSPSDRAQLEAWVQDRNAPAKWIWRAAIVLATVEGLGANAIMRRTGKSKPCVWRWQERYLDKGVEGLARDKTRPSGIAPPADDVRRAVRTKTACETPGAPTHWSRANMAPAIGMSASSVGRIWAASGPKPA
jgi:transposase